MGCGWPDERDKRRKHMNWKIWLRGLVAAFVAGGSSALTGGACAAWFDPEKFNLGSGLSVILKMMGSVFLVSGLFSMFLYLKQSPIPNFAQLSTMARYLLK
jgi:hypothetical protein